jgi:hypothetical protein
MTTEPAGLETLAAAASRYEIVKSDLAKAEDAEVQAKNAYEKKHEITETARFQLKEAEARLRMLAKSLA